MFLDVIVHPNGEDEWSAIGREAAVTGETLMLDVVENTAATELCERVPVCVIDSRPVIVDGDMRHRIRLRGSDFATVTIRTTHRVSDDVEAVR